MKALTIAILTLSPALAVSGAVLAQAQDPSPRSMSSPDVAPDNSKSNKVDPSNRNPTADQQTNNQSDIKLTQAIRRSIMEDKSLSTYAHNAKVVSSNGTVTLNGVVSSQAESDSLALKAEQIAGSGRVVNKLKVDAGR